jgi:hypothetical protein
MVVSVTAHARNSPRQGDRDAREAVGALAQTPGVHALGEAVGDDLGQELRRGVGVLEVRLVVEVAVVQRAHDGAEFLRGQTDVDDDVVVVQLGPAKRGVHQERRPVQALRGPEDLATEAVGDHQVIADGDAEQRTTLQVRHVWSPAGTMPCSTAAPFSLFSRPFPFLCSLWRSGRLFSAQTPS